MGLDSVELVMDVEERFDTTFPDAVVEHIQTVGDLYSFLMSRIRQQDFDWCSSTAMFYPIRKLLVTEFGVERRAVKPFTLLESLVETDNRYKFWQMLQAAVATQLPGLKKSRWFQWNGDMFPESCTTVAQLVDHCVDANRITTEFGPDDEDEVWQIVCELVAEIAGVDKSTLKPETSFLNDLWF